MWRQHRSDNMAVKTHERNSWDKYVLNKQVNTNNPRWTYMTIVDGVFKDNG